jgi:hypothetical protein
MLDNNIIIKKYNLVEAWEQLHLQIIVKSCNCGTFSKKNYTLNKLHPYTNFVSISRESSRYLKTRKNVFIQYHLLLDPNRFTVANSTEYKAKKILQLFCAFHCLSPSFYSIEYYALFTCSRICQS